MPWTEHRDVKVGEPCGFPRESDGWIWWHYSLYLLVNRHVADFQSDEDVSAALRKVRDAFNYRFSTTRKGSTMTNNETLPRLFGDKGVLLPDIDTSRMDAPTLERLEAIRHAYRENERAQADLAAFNQDVTEALAEIREAESFHSAHWPPQTYHDLWKENFGGGPRKTMGLG